MFYVLHCEGVHALGASVWPGYKLRLGLAEALLCLTFLWTESLKQSYLEGVCMEKRGLLHLRQASGIVLEVHQT